MDPAKRKSTILTAASKCFALKGYHATQVSDIIAKAKVARGTFYLYFKSKQEIFHAILDDFINRILAQFDDVVVGGKKSPTAQIHANAERVMDAILSDPAMVRILFNEAVGLGKEIDGRLAAFYGRLIEIIASALRRGMKLGLIRPVEPRLSACIILGSVREILVQNVVFRNTAIDRSSMINGIVDVVIFGAATLSLRDTVAVL